MLPHLPISHFLWLSYVVEQAIIFFCPVVSSVFFYLSSSFFSLSNLSGRRLHVYHTSTHGLALVRI